MSLDVNKDLIIQQNDVKLVEVVGEGGYGQVWKSKWKMLPLDWVAVKKLRVTGFQASSLAQEVSFLATLRHPNVISIYGVCLNTNELWIVMEYADGGCLTQILADPSLELPWTRRWKWATEASLALALLHSKNIIHRDIKSPNFLLNEGKLKLTDFGTSTMTSVSSIQTKSIANELSIGTARWAAPESCARKPIVNQKSDIYALGIVLWELASRQIPFAEIKDNANVIVLVKYEDARPEIPPDCPKLFSNIFTRCWDTDPQARPSAEEVSKYLVDNSEEFNELFPNETIIPLTTYDILANSSLEFSSSYDDSLATSTTESLSLNTSTLSSQLEPKSQLDKVVGAQQVTSITQSQSVPIKDLIENAFDGKDLLFIAGGYNDTSTKDTVQFYDQGHWYELSALHKKLSGAAAVYYKSLLFVLGGIADIYLDNVRAFSKTGWCDMPKLDTCRNAHSAVTFNDQIWAIGGAKGFGESLKSTEIFDFAKMRWQNGPELRDTRAMHASVTTESGQIFTLGGVNNVYSEKLNSVTACDGTKWIELSPMKTPRYQPAAVSIGKQVYALGGQDDSKYLETVEVYRTDEGKWSAAESMNNANAGFGAVVMSDGKILALGGRSNRKANESYGRQKAETLKGVEVLDPRAGGWQHSDILLPYDLCFFGCCVSKK